MYISTVLFLFLNVKTVMFFLYIKILVSEQRNTACEIVLKYHKI